MEKEILKQISKEFTLHEKIIMVLFKKTLLKAYRVGRINCFNSMQ